MTEKKRAIFIDAENRRVFPGDCDLVQAQKWVDGFIEHVTAAGFLPVVKGVKSDVYVDEHGRIRPDRKPFGFALGDSIGMGETFCGNGVIMSHDADGEMVDCPFDPLDIEKRIIWRSLAEIIAKARLVDEEIPPVSFWFRKMVNTAREGGIDCRTKENRSGPRYEAIKKSLEVIFWTAVQEAEVFVFMPPKGGPPSDEDIVNAFAGREPEALDLPFRSVAFESAPGSALMQARSSKGHLIHICAVLVHELDADRRLNFALCMIREPERLGFVVLADSYTGNVLRYYLARLQVEKDGVEKVNEVIRIPSPGKKRKYHEIKRIFHVRPKTAMTLSFTGETKSRTIEWTHRFSVRGHWVRLHNQGTIGKNRTGEYVEVGRTWRRAHEKGPEDAPKVRKIRLVSDPE